MSAFGVASDVELEEGADSLLPLNPLRNPFIVTFNQISYTIIIFKAKSNALYPYMKVLILTVWDRCQKLNLF